MPRAATSRTAADLALPRTEPPNAASVLALVQSIERHDAGSPAAVAFRAALRRKGIEADAAGGLCALHDLMHAVAEDDPIRAEARTAIVRAAWADLLPEGQL